MQNRPFKFSFFGPRAHSAASDAVFETMSSGQNVDPSQGEVSALRRAEVTRRGERVWEMMPGRAPCARSADSAGRCDVPLAVGGGNSL